MAYEQHQSIWRGSVMRAARFHAYGPPEVLRVEEVRQPVARHDEILVRVHASSINNADIGGRQGSFRMVHARHLPHTPGYDLAGEVIGCGPDVTAFLPGDRVLAMLGLSAGGQAEYATVGQTQAARLPDAVAFPEAAAIPLAGLTALQGLRRYGNIKPGDRVLINGAAGGVGSFAVQIAKLVGCHVTATCRRERFDYVAQLGADELVDYREEHPAARGQIWDVVLDAAGNLDFETIRRSVTEVGVVVAARTTPKLMLETVRTRLVRGPRYTFFITKASGHDLGFLASLVAQGRLRPPIDRLFSLDEIEAANRYYESGASRGKIVIQI
jgi:NADPH:quinone reductase